MIIRSEAIEDYNKIYEITKETFKQENESKLIDRVRAGKNFFPELSLVAEEKGKIVGHILFSKIKIRGEKDHETLVLAPMTVLPKFQKQGIGGKTDYRRIKQSQRTWIRFGHCFRAQRILSKIWI